MIVRRWGAAALLTLTLVGCSKPAPSSGTLPPLTASTSVSPSPTAITSTGGSTTATTTSTSDATASSNPSPSITLATGDRSEAAAVAAAKNAVGAIYRVAITQDVTEFNSISYENCNYRSRMITAVAMLKSAHAHVVTTLPTDISAKVLRKEPGVVTVQLKYVVPPEKAINDKGKVIEDVNAYTITDVYQMNYIDNRWLLYFVEDPTP